MSLIMIKYLDLMTTVIKKTCVSVCVHINSCISGEIKQIEAQDFTLSQ